MYVLYIGFTCHWRERERDKKVMKKKQSHLHMSLARPRPHPKLGKLHGKPKARGLKTEYCNICTYRYKMTERNNGIKGKRVYKLQIQTQFVYLCFLKN